MTLEWMVLTLMLGLFWGNNSIKKEVNGNQTWTTKALIRCNMLSERTSGPRSPFGLTLASSPRTTVTAQTYVVPRLPPTAGLLINLKRPDHRVESPWNPSMARKLILSNSSVRSTALQTCGHFWCVAQAFLNPKSFFQSSVPDLPAFLHLHLSFEPLPSQQEGGRLHVFFPQSCLYEKCPRCQLRSEHQTSYICRKKGAV